MNMKEVPGYEQLTIFSRETTARPVPDVEDPAAARRKAIAKALYERYYGGGGKHE